MFADIKDALGLTFGSQLVRAWNRTSKFMERVTVVSGGGQGGGQHVGWNVQFSGATANSFPEGADVAASEFSKDTERPATLPWGQYRAAFELSNLELNIAANNIGNAQEIERLLEERLFDAIAKITSEMNKDAISGTGTASVDFGSGPVNVPTMVGILTALNNSGQYATIDPGTYPEWAGNVLANGGIPRPLTLELLAKGEQAQFVASGQSAEILITTPGIKTKYESLFNSVQRMNAGAGGPIARMDASAEDLYWRGREIVRDKDTTSGVMAGVVASDIELRLLPWAPVPDMVPMPMHQLVSSDGQNKRFLGAFVKVYPLGRTGSSVKFVAEIYAQLKVRRRNAHFLIKDIAET